MDNLPTAHAVNSFTPANLVWAMMGSFVLQAFLIAKEKPIINFLRVFNSDWEGKVAVFLNAIVFSVIGGLVGCGLVQPITSAQALSAGLSWIGLVSGLHSPPEPRDAKRSAPSSGA